MTLIIYAKGLCFCSVCTDSTDVEEIERVVNAMNPTGLTHGWKISPEYFRTGEPNPHPCEKSCGRKHYLLEC